MGLKVAHPGRPHRLTLTVNGGHPAALGVALIESAAPGRDGAGRPRVALDACASGPPILEGGPAASFSWLVWPDAPEPVLVMVNRARRSPVQLGTVTLTELAEVPPAPPLFEPDPAARRTLGLYLADPDALDRFGFGGGEPAPGDLLAVARNLAAVRDLVRCVGGGPPRAARRPGPAAGTRRPGRRGRGRPRPSRPVAPRSWAARDAPPGSSWRPMGCSPASPPRSAPEALARGLVRVDRHGNDRGPAYHPLHPEVRAAMKRRVTLAIAPRRGRPGLSGVLIRLGPGPTLLGGPDTGFDDATYARFVRETFDPGDARGVPGLGTSDPGRFAARAKFLAGLGPDALADLAIARHRRALRRAGRTAVHGPRRGRSWPWRPPASMRARRAARRGGWTWRGCTRSHAWRAVGLDLEAWANGDGAPIVLRGVGLSTDALAHDLATSPELDALVAARPGRGLLLGVNRPGSIDSAASSS